MVTIRLIISCNITLRVHPVHPSSSPRMEDLPTNPCKMEDTVASLQAWLNLLTQGWLLLPTRVRTTRVPITPMPLPVRIEMTQTKRNVSAKHILHNMCPVVSCLFLHVSLDIFSGLPLKEFVLNPCSIYGTSSIISSSKRLHKFWKFMNI